MTYTEKKEYVWNTDNGPKQIDELTKEQLVIAVHELIREIEDLKKQELETNGRLVLGIYRVTNEPQE